MLNKITTLRLIKGLNAKQREVALDYTGPCFVSACPGSGKTLTLVKRTQYMIYKGVDPKEILLFTFTIKAANEIKNRIAKYVGDAAQDITIGTYHSICLKLIKQYRKLLNLNKHFTIYNDDDRNNIIKELVKGSTIDSKELSNYISRKKDLMESAQACWEYSLSHNGYDKNKAELYYKYQERLKKENAIDFDDIIFYAITLLQNFNYVKEAVNEQYKYIISDETQDASYSNLLLLKLLNGYNNICLFLDDDQSIYSFRGANVKEIINTEKHFGKMKSYVLDTNYRSTQTIVKAARELIANNKYRINKDCNTINDCGEKIIYTEKFNKEQEADYVASVIKFLTIKHKLKYSDIAVLYRNNVLSKAIETALLKTRIPYHIKNHINLMDRYEIKIIIHYMRFIMNPYDYEAFKYIVNIPKRSIGESTIQKIYTYWNENSSMDLLTACKSIELSKKVKSNLKEFCKLIEELKYYINIEMPNEFILRIINVLNYTNYLKEYDVDNYCERYSNVIDLIEISKGFMNNEEFISSFMIDSEEIDSDEDQVNLMTIHSCKGLEWKAVILIGASNTILPGKDCDMEEERRLFYVAITRAQKYLFITRHKYEAGRPEPLSCSRFVKEINPEYIIKN